MGEGGGGKSDRDMFRGKSIGSGTDNVLSPSECSNLELENGSNCKIDQKWTGKPAELGK